jgi:hypothetical protein
MAREADGGEGGVDNRFLHDGPFEPPLYRIKRAPPDKILALKASRAAALVRAASRKLDVAMERAAKHGELPQEPERDDEGVKARVDSRRVAEILAPYRRAFDAMDPGEQERFLETIRLFAAERIKLSQWRAVARAAEERYRAALPAPEPPGGRVKAKDRPSHPPQGW